MVEIKNNESTKFQNMRDWTGEITDSPKICLIMKAGSLRLYARIIDLKGLDDSKRIANDVAFVDININHRKCGSIGQSDL
jgi:hypothetical protein